MSAQVSSLARLLGAYVDVKREPESERTTAEPVTRDFLGVCSSGADGGAKELDLDLVAPTGWERRLDLKIFLCHGVLPEQAAEQSGEVFLQRSSYADAASVFFSKATELRNQDGNQPPLLPLFPSPLTQDLPTAAPALAEYQSVCTLDAIKSALDRFNSAAPSKKSAQPNRSGSSSVSVPRSWSRSETASRSGSPASSSTTVSSQSKLQSREGAESGTTTEEDGVQGRDNPLDLKGCPSCLTYVLIHRSRHRCPKCNTLVLEPAKKKPRLDLNLNFSASTDAVDDRS